MKQALICGAGGFIGSHLVKRLKSEGYWVRGVDLKHPQFGTTAADDFVIGNLLDQIFCNSLFDRQFDEVYQLAADMGGAGYILTGNSDADVMYNSASINLNLVNLCKEQKAQKSVLFFFSVYISFIQPTRPEHPKCEEDSAYPAQPDSEYGWEKLFSERLYLSFMRNYKLNVRIARLHNIYGPEGIWYGGKEKAPAALCRKVCGRPKKGARLRFGAMGNKPARFYI